MYVATIPNRNSRPAILLREGYRENGKVKNRTLKNLSNWPAERVELLRAALRGDGLAPAGEGMEIERALPHGHVLAALGTARAIDLDALLPRGKERRHQLALALIVARVLAPSAKLATARALDPATASHSLGATLELGPVKVKELYATLDWLGKHQEGIERRLARRHLGSGTLVLYDVTSSYLEGRHCPLARRGYSRDGKKGKLQIVFGLICNAAGCPVAVEVFESHCGDPATLSAQLDKLKRRFGLRRIVLVGDRGLITSARIDEELRPAGFDWMTALRAPAIAKLAGEEGPLQLSLFDQRSLAEIDSPDYPGERLIACRNPALAAERARKREELLAATDVELRRIQGRVRRARRPLRGPGEIGLAVGAVINRRKVAKHFEIAITDEDFPFQRKPAAIAAEAALDGIYVLRTSLPAETLDGERARAGLQEPRPCRARLPQPGDRRHRGPPDPSLDQPARARPCFPLHAGLSSRMAHAPGARADAVRRPPARRGRGRADLARGQGQGLACRQTKGRGEENRRRAAGAQLPLSSRRSRHSDQKHRRLRQEAVHDDPGKAHANTEKGSQTARHKTGRVDRSSSRRRGVSSTYSI